MALQKQNINIPLGTGLNQKKDDKQLNIESPKRLENFVFDKVGKLIKRYGYESLHLEDTEGNNITDGAYLTNFNEELELLNNENMYSYISSIKKWANRGASFTAVPSSSPVIRTTIQQSKLDSTHVDGLNIFTWQDSNGIGLSIVESETGNSVLNNETLSATGTNPKVTTRGSEVYIFYVDSSAIKYRKFAIYDFETIEAEVTAIASIHATNQQYDIDTIGNNIALAFSKVTSGDLSITTINESDTVDTPFEVTGEVPTTTLSLGKDSADRIICTYYDGTDAKIVIMNYSANTKLLAETSLETIANVTNITAIESDTEEYTILYEISAVASYNHTVRKQTINIAGTTGTAAVLLRSVGLASKLFTYNSNEYVLTIHSNTLQSTYFLINISGKIVSKISPDTGGSLISASGLPRVAQIDDSNFLVTSQVKGRLAEDNGTFFSLLGVNGTVLNFDTTSDLQDSTLASNLHLAGGVLKMYDGYNLVEHGFNVYPEGLSKTSSATTGGALSDGTYQYKAVYSWTDSQGTIHKSAPSIGLEVVLSGGGSAQTAVIRVPTLRLTDKTNVTLELYRTEASGTIFYMVTSTSSPIQNNKVVDYIDITDSSVSDTDLINNEVLYTTGGELENIAASPSSIIESFQTRLFITSPKSRKLNYSKIQFEGFPVEFNNTLEIKLPEVGGDNIALITIGDKIILFKERAIYYLSGNGPNNLGEQDDFNDMELVTAEIGCINAKSIVRTPMGILFKSQKGMYLITGSMQLGFIGSQVEDFNNLSISSATSIDSKNEVRFTTSDGECLVFNYIQQKWATFTNHKGLSARSVSGDYYYLKPDNTVLKQTTEFVDNGSPIKSTLETGWISLAGIQGFQRIYKILILGGYKSDHKLKISIAYDFKESYVQEKTVDVSDFIDAPIYGVTSPYGSDSYYGGNGTPYQIRLDLKRQKCQSIKIKIEDIQSEAGEGMDLSSIVLKVGAKSSENKNFKQEQITGTN